MAAPERFDHLRHAALDLLDAGNTMAAVSQLLSVPLAVVARWREEPVPPRPAPAAPPVSPKAKAAPAGKATRFATTLVVLRGFENAWMGHVAIGYGLLALTVGLLAWTLHVPGSLGDCLEADATALVACAWWWNRRHRPLLTLTPDAIVVPILLGSVTLPYADLADWWLVMHVKNEGRDNELEGRLLTLHSRRPGMRPIELFVHDFVDIDPRVTERLDEVKKANSPGLLTPMGR